MQYKITIALFFCLFLNSDSFSQENGLESDAIDQNKIEQLSNAILQEHPKQIKDSLSNALLSCLKLELSKNTSFAFPFNEVKSLSILTSPDSLFKLFNWEISYLDGSNRYECIMQKRNGETPELIQFTPLDTIIDDEILINEPLSSERWLPALYYKIIPVKTRLQTYYTLLGWDGNDLLTNRKYIDVLWFNKGGEVNFGAGLFKDNRSVQSRVIFKYGGQNSMALNFEEQLDRISFDHLAPPSSNLEGIFEYYGADITFDAYDWNGKYWNLVQEIIPAWADPKGRTEAKVTNKKFDENQVANPASAKKILDKSERQLKNKDDKLKEKNSEKLK